MLVAGFPAGPWGTNCWVVASGANAECVVIDPGFDAMAPLADLLGERGLKPIAVALTHGHVDHMWSVYPVSKGYDIPALVHPDDRHLLGDPLSGISPEGRAMVAQMGGSFVEPEVVSEVTDNMVLELAGISFHISHAPGHTPGSVVYTCQDSGDSRMFSGDVLFRGSIGRTDLPGGDHAAMLNSLERVIDQASDDLVVHCGHGPDTTIGYEKQTNPYIRGLQSRSGL